MSTSSINTGLSGWASGGTVTPPAAGRVTDGWENGSPLEAPNRNYAWQTTSQIADFLTGASWDVDLIVGRTVTNNLLNLNASGDFDIQGDADLQLSAGAGGTDRAGLTFTSIGGWLFQYTDTLGPTTTSILGYGPSDGLQCLAGWSPVDTGVPLATEGMRVPYAGGLSLDFYLTDSNGSWQQNGTAAAFGTGFSATGYVTFGYPGASTYTWHRDLVDVLQGHNAETAAEGTYTRRLTGLGATLDASGGDDILIELVAQNRSTHVDTVVMQLPSTGTPHAGGATAFTDTATHDVDLSTSRYFVRVTCVGTGAASVAARDLKLTATLYATH